MSSQIESKDYRSHEEEMKTVRNFTQVEHAEKPAALDSLRAEAIEAENVEHNMTVMQAVKAYPMATFWAFVMSFTIVS